MPTITLNGTVIANSTGTLYYQGENTDVRYLRTSADDTLTGKIAVGLTTARQAGMYGIYESTKIGHIWGMGAGYTIDASGANFGTLYGLAYKHTNNTTGGTMAGGHQAMWVTAGVPKVALGDSGVWTTGNIWWNSGADDLNSLKSSVSSGKTAIASSITAKGIAASGSETHAQLAVKIDGLMNGITGEELITAIANGTVTKFDAVYASLLTAKITNPAYTPSLSQGADFSHDSTYLAMALQNYPFVAIFKRAGDVFTKLADPAFLPSNYTVAVAFSHDSTYLAFAGGGSNLVIYKRAGDVFTKLTDVNPGNATYCVEFSHDSTYLVVGFTDAPYIVIYKRAGDVFTRLANPAQYPAAAGYGVSFSHDSTYLAIAHNYSPYVTIFKRSGDTFTKLANPAVLPPTHCSCLDFSHDSTYLIVGTQASPWLTLYKRSGDTFTKLADPEITLLSPAKGIHFSHDSSLVAMAHDQAPYMSIYQRSGDRLIKLSNPSTPPTFTSYHLAFSHDSSYIAVTGSNTPSLSIYKNTIGVYKSDASMSMPANVMWYGYAKASASSGQSIQVAKLWR